MMDRGYDEVVERGEITRGAGGGFKPERILAWIGLQQTGGGRVQGRGRCVEEMRAEC